MVTEVDAVMHASVAIRRLCRSCGLRRPGVAFHAGRRAVCRECRAGKPVAAGFSGPLAELDPMELVAEHERLTAEYRARRLAWDDLRFARVRAELAARCQLYGAVEACGVRFGWSPECGEAVRCRRAARA